MKVLIIGSSGFMARNLASALLNFGAEVVLASSSDSSGIDPRTGLLPDGFSVQTGTTAVVYMAQSPGYIDVPEQAPHVLSVNSLSAVRAAKAARAAGVSRFIYLSTGTVYAPCFSPISESFPVRRDNWYSLSKLHGEEALELFRPDFDIVVLRPFGVYGPGQTGRLVPNLVESIGAGRPITLQPSLYDADDLSGLKISLCFVDDATNIIIEILRNGGPSRLNIAGPEALSIREISERIGKIIGRPPQFSVGSTKRNFDLVADTTLLRNSLNPSFTPLDIGIQRLVSLGLS